MDKGKGPAQMEKFQKDRDSPAHGASEESEEASGTERLNLERQENIDEISSEAPVNDATKPPMNNPTDQVVPKYLEDGDKYESTVDDERSAKRRKPALKVNIEGESSTNVDPMQEKSQNELKEGIPGQKPLEVLDMWKEPEPDGTTLISLPLTIARALRGEDPW